VNLKEDLPAALQNARAQPEPHVSRPKRLLGNQWALFDSLMFDQRVSFSKL
jgi:hypothetical protein